MIHNKFIYIQEYSKLEGILKQIAPGLDPVIFIADTGQIYTCGTFFDTGSPEIKIEEIDGYINVFVGLNKFTINTTGDSLSLRKGDGNDVIISSSALTKLLTAGPLEWDQITKTIKHSTSGVARGNYGQDFDLVNASLITFPYITVNEYGHIIEARNSTVQIRDYVEQIAAGNQNVDRNILQAYESGQETSTAAQSRKSNGLTFNDSTQVLKTQGGLESNGEIIVHQGNLEVKNGVIVGNLEGDVSGSATPKIHLSVNPEYGGSSKNMYGHVILKDAVPDRRPEPSSDNTQPTDAGVIANAASPLMVYDALEEAKKYTDDVIVKISAVDTEGSPVYQITQLEFSEDFEYDKLTKKLSLKWEEIQ